MKSRTLLMTFVIGVVFCFTANLFGVTNEEVEKIRSAMPKKPVVQPEKSRTMLVFSLCNGYVHDSIPYWQRSLDIMGDKSNRFFEILLQSKKFILYLFPVDRIDRSEGFVH